MGTMSFNYVKEPGDESNRVFIPITSPSELYFGIDITELDFEDQGLFANDLEDILDEQKEKIDNLMQKYDIKFKYRSFYPSKMKGIVTD